MEKAKYQILNSLAIKIIAFLTMTLDHIGVFLMKYARPIVDPTDPSFFTNPMNLTGYIFRIIGRLAFPLFALLIVEGIRNTKNLKNYVYRLSIMALLVFTVSIFAYHFFNFKFENIFFTFLCSIGFIYFINKKDRTRFLIIPIVLFVIMGAIPDLILQFSDGSIDVMWWPHYLRPQYSIYGFLMIIGMYYAYKLTDKRVLSIVKEKKDIEVLRNTGYYRTFANILIALVIFIDTGLIYLFAVFNNGFNIYNISIQSYAMIALIFPLLYNGEKGYSNKKLQHTFYLYYPVHLLILFIIFFTIFGM